MDSDERLRKVNLIEVKICHCKRIRTAAEGMRLAVRLGGPRRPPPPHSLEEDPSPLRRPQVLREDAEAEGMAIDGIDEEELVGW